MSDRRYPCCECCKADTDHDDLRLTDNHEEPCDECQTAIGKQLRRTTAERDTLAARLAAVEAIVTDWGAGTVHRPRSPHYHRLRDALATGATTDQRPRERA